MEPFPLETYIRFISNGLTWYYYVHARTKTRGYYIIENLTRNYEGQISPVGENWLLQHNVEIISANDVP